MLTSFLLSVGETEYFEEKTAAVVKISSPENKIVFINGKANATFGQQQQSIAKTKQ